MEPVSLENEPGSGARQRRALVALLIFAILFLPLLTALGFWQLDRSEQKERLLTDIRNRQAMPPVTAEQLVQEQGDWLYRQAQLEGEFDPRYQWLLDNRTWQGRFGYEVVSLFRLKAGAGWVLVNRGWISAPVSREFLPEVPVPEGVQQIRGQVEEAERPRLVLKELPPETGWPRRVQYLDLAVLQEEAGQEILPWLIQLGEDQPGALVPLPQRSPMGPETHLGSAVQWFGLAAVLLLGTLIAVFKTRKDVS